MQRAIHPATCTCGPVCMKAAYAASSDRSTRAAGRQAQLERQLFEAVEEIFAGVEGP